MSESTASRWCKTHDEPAAECWHIHMAPEPADQTRADVVPVGYDCEYDCMIHGDCTVHHPAARDAEHAAEMAKCSCCGETPVINPRPHDDIVVCEPCMHLMWDADAAEFRSRAEAAEATVARVSDLLPDECWVSRSAEVRCTEYVGGDFPNGARFTEEMCCLPCRIRAALDGER